MTPRRSFNKIPTHLKQEIANLPDDDFTLFAVQEIGHPAIEDGEWAHLQIRVQNGEVTLPGEVLPDRTHGVWARRNQDGWWYPRKDLPMIEQSITFDTPNFGDWSYGSHSVTWTQDVYQRDGSDAYGWGIEMRKLRETPTSVTISFELVHVFDRATLDDVLLKFAINVMQESCGDVRIRESGIPVSSYIATLEVDWEILPPGDADEVIRVAVERLQPDAEGQRVIDERMRVLLGMNPRRLVVGTSRFARYVGGMFAEDLVVFENIRYGNAIYVMFEDWETLSRRSRVELMRAADDRFVRVTHTRGWQDKLRTIVRSELWRRGR